MTITAGQRHDSVAFEFTVEAARISWREARSRSLPDAFAADKAYSFKRIRDWLRRRKVERVIPQRTTQEGRRGGCRDFDKTKYKGRNVVERCICWLKESRRVATRFEKLARNFLAMVKLAMILRYLRLVP